MRSKTASYLNLGDLIIFSLAMPIEFLVNLNKSNAAIALHE